MAFNRCDQIVSRVPNPDLLVVLTVFDACAQGLAVPGAQACQDFGHVVHVKLIGQRLKAFDLIKFEGQFWDRNLIQMHMAHHNHLGLIGAGVMDVSQSGAHLIQ